MKTQVFIPKSPELPASELKNLIIDRFGGFTKFDAIGAWRMPDGSICQEPVEIVEVFSTSKDRAANESWFSDHCYAYGIEAKQDAVLVVHDNEPIFLETKAAA